MATKTKEMQIFENILRMFSQSLFDIRKITLMCDLVANFTPFNSKIPKNVSCLIEKRVVIQILHEHSKS